ncbi:GCN5-related N-acetyltransferase [Stanieria cyanosphaera PCC 7437]|uniref:GCN5-related N-acetyltransferase n=1 Tax=Stanieria cyanosphaera (strain ATCC 29371 / PCC 7437) TaxID=111780 RepID=K9XUR9_STAC7|nr:GNAT family N-acetyltransferase [Stanieria cyanosphaera]AFZ35804.1 GCN5-related N-acetyltransferase [Stanieria cyanosphaera PCC 7437]
MVWLETQRLILRDFQQNDVDQLARIFANPQVMQFSPTGILSALETKEKVDSFITSYKTLGFGKWAIVFKETKELIGYCGIAVEQIDKVPKREIGYRLDPNFWGKGLAIEAASATVQYGFEQLKFAYILGIVEQANTTSVRVLKKLGMRYERKTIFYGVEMDVYRLNATA